MGGISPKTDTTSSTLSIYDQIPLPPESDYGDSMEHKLKRLQMENHELEQKLNVMQNERKKRMLDMDNKDDIMSEFDDDDMDEMENLFKKCDLEMQFQSTSHKKRRKSLIEKYKLLWFQSEIKRTDWT